MRDPVARYRRHRSAADALERDAIAAALERSDCYEARAAALLGIPRQTLHRWLLPRGRYAEIGRQIRARLHGRGAPPRAA